MALHEKHYSALKIAALVAAMADAGLTASAALAGTGLTAEQVHSPLTRTSIHQVLVVGRNAVRLGSSPGLGLRAGLRMHASAYGMWGYALLCAETMRHAVEMAMRYHRLATPVMPACWTEDRDRAICAFPGHEEQQTLGLTLDEHLFFLEMQIALTATLAKDVMGPWCVPACALFATPQPAHAELVAQSLQCPVLYDQSSNELHYPAIWLDRAPQLANPIAAEQMSITCARLMQEFKWQGGLARRVYDELTRTPGHFPEVETIASSLCTTTRTLRRKLADEGTSYSELLSNVRHALAVDYLSTTMLSVEEIARALGFSDMASFRHAFKRWSGKTPNAYRRQ